MNRVHSYSANDEVTSADLNNIQDTALGIAQVVGLVVGATQMTVTSTVITVRAVTAFPSGTEAVRAAAANLTLTPGALTASTWYAVYVYDNSGTLALEVSTTQPEAALTHKTSDTTRRYVGSVLTNGSGGLIPVVKHGNRYVWRQSAFGSLDTHSPFSNTSRGAITLSGPAGGSTKMLPAHARLIELRLAFVNQNLPGTSGTTRTLKVWTESDTTSANGIVFSVDADVASYPDVFATFDVGTGQSLEGQVSTGDLDVFVAAHGFYE